MFASGGLCVGTGKAGCVFGEVFGNDDGEIGRRKEEGLITEKASDSGEGHRSTVAGQFGKRTTFCDAVGIPCHK
jgi:hypothetical protein